MELERGIIKGFFYDYPLQHYVDIMDGNKVEKDFIDAMPDFLKWVMPAFDVKELRQTVNAYSVKWRIEYVGYRPTVWPLLYLPEVANKLLTVVREKPYVRNGQLLRWRMLSLPISEDLLTLSFMAWNEKNMSVVRENFVWEDTITTESISLAQLRSKKRLVDIHSHLGASSDAFNIRWIHWMNNKTTNYSKKEKYSKEKKLINVARVIRYCLFEICQGGYIEDSDKECIRLGINEETFSLTLANGFDGKINGAKHNSLKPNIGILEHWDYGILGNISLQENDLASPYMLHVGERAIIYGFLRLFYKNKNVLFLLQNISISISLSKSIAVNCLFSLTT